MGSRELSPLKLLCFDGTNVGLFKFVSSLLLATCKVFKPRYLSQDVHQFLEEYHALADKMNATTSDFYAPLTYDAVWSLALALNDSIPKLNNLDLGGLANFTYDSGRMTEAFMQSMYGLKFEGMMVCFE